jgi:hypothetical protein
MCFRTSEIVYVFPGFAPGGLSCVCSVLDRVLRCACYCLFLDNCDPVYRTGLVLPGDLRPLDVSAAEEGCVLASVLIARIACSHA